MNLPMDADAELQVVGGMLADPSLVVPVCDIVGPEDFSYHSVRAVFEAIGRLSGRGRDIDAVTVKGELVHDSGALDRLMEAMSAVTYPRHALQHARRVKDLSRLRSLAQLGSEIIEEATKPGAEYDKVIEVAERGVFQTSEGYLPVDWPAATEEALTRLEYRYSTDQVVTGLPTGLQALDYRLTGLHPGWLVYVGARPSTGKTALAVQIALHAAGLGTPVLFVSLEMSQAEIASRALCSHAGISYTKVRRDQLSDEDWLKFVQAEDALRELPLELYDAGAVTVPQIMSRVRHSKPGLVCVDYVGLIRPDRFHQRKDIELSEISAGLKAIARECHVPVLACVQLNRNFQKREDKGVEMQDLRDSGAFEQDADVVLLLQRDEKDPKHVTLKCEKFRHGPTGTDKLRWHADITRFDDALA